MPNTGAGNGSGERVIPPVGAKVYVRTDKLPFTVRCRNERYAVCTKPFAARKTVMYCILDAREGWRAPENLIFGLGAETDQQCEQMLERVTKGVTELSERRGVDWDVWKVVPAPNAVPSVAKRRTAP